MVNPYLALIISKLDLINSHGKMKEYIANFGTKKHSQPNCMWPKCQQQPITTHVISKNWISAFEPAISKLETLHHNTVNAFQALNDRNFFRPLNLKKEPAFPGFCKDHDFKKFEDLDKYRIDSNTIPNKILLLAHYRIICYGLYITETLILQCKSLTEDIRPFDPLLTDNELPYLSNLIADTTIKHLQVIKDAHRKRKYLCEKILSSRKEEEVLLYRHIPVSKTNPLVVGRGGEFLRNPISFSDLEYPYLSDPYVSFITFLGEKENFLVFIALPMDIDAFNDVNRWLEHPDVMGYLGLVHYLFHDNCIFSNDHRNYHSKSILDVMKFRYS